MFLSDVSVKRPVFASVLALLLIAFGVVSFERLPLREYPDIDPPVVSVETQYPGAAANVVESRITEIIEERVAGVEGIRFIESKSEDGESTVTIEFGIDRDVDDAANDIQAISTREECSVWFVSHDILFESGLVIRGDIRRIADDHIKLLTCA